MTSTTFIGPCNIRTMYHKDTSADEPQILRTTFCLQIYAKQVIYNLQREGRGIRLQFSVSLGILYIDLIPGVKNPCANGTRISHVPNCPAQSQPTADRLLNTSHSARTGLVLKHNEVAHECQPTHKKVLVEDW